MNMFIHTLGMESHPVNVATAVAYVREGASVLSGLCGTVGIELAKGVGCTTVRAHAIEDTWQCTRGLM